MCTHEHMPFTFQIRPVSLEKGFELSCEGILAQPVRHRPLLNAIVHAAQLGRDLNGEIRIYDRKGRLVDTLPLHPEQLTPANA